MGKPTVYHYDTYREELGKAYSLFGYALWDPDPGEYSRVRVGDVGYTQGGKFHRLFNALLSEDDLSRQKLRYGPPEHYEQLRVSFPDHIDRGYLAPNDLHSSGITKTSGGFSGIVPVKGLTVGANVSFSSKEKHGAVLSLPVKSLREDTLAVDQFREWITRNIDSWFALTQNLKLGRKMEDIILVTGCHRTRSWSNIAFHGVVEGDKQFSLGVNVTGDLGANIKWQSSTVNVSGALHNQGPNGEKLPENQCIFIRGFRVKPILGKFHQIKAEAEPRPDSCEKDYKPKKEVISIPSVSEYQDPLHVILDYIAKKAPEGCDMALVHDDDLKRILEAYDSTSLETLQLDVMGLLERLKPEIVPISYSFPIDDTIPRTDKKSINVAMLSAHLKSLDHPSYIPLLPDPSASAANREENVGDGALGHTSELALPAPQKNLFQAIRSWFRQLAKIYEQAVAPPKSPDSLDEKYKRALQTITGTNETYAYRLFQCLAVAIRPLRVEELAEVLALDFRSAQEGGVPELNTSWRWEDHEAEILTACSSLIDIVDNPFSDTRVVQFTDVSLREFLISDRLAATDREVSRFHIRLEAAHTVVAQACLGVLLHSINSGSHERVGGRSPLAAYAARHWVDHAQFDGVSHRIRDAMRLLFDPAKPHFAAWLKLYDIDKIWSLFGIYSRRAPPTLPPTPLYYASLCGFRDLSVHLIAEYPEQVNARAGFNCSPLVAALHKRHFDVAQLLYEHGATVDVTGYQGRTPLYAACAEGLQDVAQWLLNHGADANLVQESGWTPLNIATKNGHLEVTQILLKHGVDVNAANVDKRTPLHQASDNGDLETVRLLLEHGADVGPKTSRLWTPLHSVSFRGNTDIVKILVDYGADVSAQDCSDWTPLRCALSEGKTDIVKLLVDHGADVNARDERGETPLFLALSKGMADTVKILIDHGADVDARDKSGETPLHHAWYKGKTDTVKILVDLGADVNARDKSGSTLLHRASSMKTDIMKILDLGADVNARDERDSTPLHLASSMGSVETVQLLIYHGADVGAKNCNLWTPLHYASFHRQTTITKLLVNHGADVNARDESGSTPLHLAFSEEQTDIRKILVDHGADVNARNESDSTPLHLASSKGLIETVRLLIDHGADVDAKNNRGQTPYDVALQSDRDDMTTKREIVQLLSDHHRLRTNSTWLNKK